MCPYNNDYIILPKTNFGTFGASKAPCKPQVYMTLKHETLSTQTPRGQELLGHIKKYWQIKIIAHEKGLNFMRNPKLAHILAWISSLRNIALRIRHIMECGLLKLS